jgi:hypothetical protein
LCAWRDALDANRVLWALFTCERPPPISAAAAAAAGGPAALLRGSARGRWWAGGAQGRRRRSWAWGRRDPQRRGVVGGLGKWVGTQEGSGGVLERGGFGVSAGGGRGGEGRPVGGFRASSRQNKCSVGTAARDRQMLIQRPRIG